MKKMKKLLCMILALMFVLSLATTAFADDTNYLEDEKTVTAEGDNNIAIVAVAQKAEAASAGVVFKVNISWELTPTYYTIGADTYTWNAETLKYELKSTGSSYTKTSDAEITITVTNYSNVSVNAGFKLDSNAKVKWESNGLLAVDSAAKGITIGDPAAEGTAATKDFTRKLTLKDGVTLAAEDFAEGVAELGSVIVTLTVYEDYECK